ncbi:glycosyl transferase group 1 [Desulfarculus baarsii DSM 2075]|uniref:Glycosyl transferase group 1 n=1 Tax=Desulfarculus baarsii (strain ATCC 33931 / DSM 2075 / LMG 7858 / VKM B-1802 / 2st14) TaxID=644282 RepID=E1QFN9_DESB2|nr:glycosyltransferase [Desulfarculus baarsii]ADK84375.1 glycosyl transferase group 1 [Desulfarculus baarsii DSM 2075]
MKILQVAHNFPPLSWAGTENYTLGLSLALRRRGVEVEVIHPVFGRGQGLERLEMLGLPTWRVGLDDEPTLVSLVDRRSAAIVCDVAQEGGFELIHAQHLLGFSAEVVYEAQRRGLPVVLTLHDFWIICPLIFGQTPSQKPCPGRGRQNCLNCLMEAVSQAGPRPDLLPTLERFWRERDAYLGQMLKLPSKVLAVSRFVARTMAARGLAGPNMAVMPAGVVPFTLGPNPGPDPADGLVLAFMGNIMPLKGPHLAARAIDGLAGARLEIHGKAVNQPYAAGLLALCEDKPETFSYHGPYDISQRGGVLARCHALVVPSLTESYCLTAREALFAGRPVLASDVGGIPEAVRHGQNGLLFPPGDWRSLRRLAQRLIERPEELAALTRGVRQPHTVTEDAEKYLSLYRRILASG